MSLIALTASSGSSGGSALQVNASGVSANDSGFIGCGIVGSTGTPSTSVSGGSGNNAFLWSREGAAATYGPWVCSDVTMQNPVWHAPGPVCADASLNVETWRVAVTDNSTGQLGTTTIQVTVIWIDLR